ncbi:MAG: uroporphyrinogen decarboxylase family protein [Puniceicoccaceae bacterium]
MSKAYGIEFLRNRGRKAGEKIPVMEHYRGLSREAVKALTGTDPLLETDRMNETYLQLGELLDVDLNWGVGLPVPEKDETHDWSDGQSVKTSREGHPVVQWGIFHVTAQDDGRHFLHIPLPKDIDEALEFDPLKYFPKTVDEYVEEFQAEYQQMLDSTSEVTYPIPHHYTTCFHWPLAIFGFELLCEAGMEQEDFHCLMERFAEVSRRITTAWSRVEGLEGLILHDDLTMTAGPIFHPDWYHKHVFPFYPDIFAPLKEKGIPIIFTSDGNCSKFVDDIIAAGADGLNFEYLVDLETLANRHPDKILVGNINNATIAEGPKDKITREVEHCLLVGKEVPGFVVNVGGGLTHQIPIDNLRYYIDLRKKLCHSL